MRFVKFFAVFALVLGLSQSAFAATANWGEEMVLSPAASGWAVFDGNWGNFITVGPTGTWIGTEMNGYVRTTDATGHPLANLGSYTMEYRVRLLDEINRDAGNYAVTVYNGGPDTARSRTQYGWFGAEFGQWGMDYPVKGETAEYDMPALEWQVARVVMDQGANTHKLFVNGVELISNSGGASAFPDTDDPLLSVGSGDPVATAVEYDYIRVYNGVLPISEPLNAVPEPSTLSLLGLAGLALLFRRRR